MPGDIYILALMRAIVLHLIFTNIHTQNAELTDCDKFHEQAHSNWSIYEEDRDKTLQRALNTVGICIAKFAETSSLCEEARALNPPPRSRC